MVAEDDSGLVTSSSHTWLGRGFTSQRLIHRVKRGHQSGHRLLARRNAA